MRALTYVLHHSLRQTVQTTSFGKVDPPHQSHPQRAVELRHDAILQAIDHFAPNDVGDAHCQDALAQCFRLGAPRELKADDIHPSSSYELYRINALFRYFRQRVAKNILERSMFSAHVVIMSRA